MAERRERRNPIPVGRRPLGKSDAWWALSRQAKRLLAAERKAGLYGGTPGRAPYWLSQEEGNDKAQIKGQHYLRQAREEFAAETRALVRRWLAERP